MSHTSEWSDSYDIWNANIDRNKWAGRNHEVMSGVRSALCGTKYESTSVSVETAGKDRGTEGVKR